jgi:hypothetical protein
MVKRVGFAGQGVPWRAMDGELPLIDAAGLSAGQLDGTACVRCSKVWPAPEVPCGRTSTGQVLYRCADCVVVLDALA